MQNRDKNLKFPIAVLFAHAAKKKEIFYLFYKLNRTQKYPIFSGSIIIALFLSAIWPETLSADTLYLKNGQTIDGVIEKETDAQVIIDVGAGVFTFNKTEVERVEKNTQRNEIAEEQNEPQDPTEKELNKLITKARVKRRLVSRYNSERHVVEAKIEKVEAQLRPLYKELEKVSDALEKYEPGESLPIHEWKRAHAAVTSRDKTLSQIKDYELELGVIKKEETEIAKNLGQALAEYATLNASITRLYDVIIRNDTTGTMRDKLQYVKKMIDRYKDDWESKSIPLQKSGNSYHVEVQLNDSKFYTFLLDTGASAVIITRAMANEIGVRPSEEFRTVDCKIADGSIVEGKAVILRSVSVGGMRAEDVQAIIMEEDEEKSVNPLLGMTYLQHFYFQIDAPASKLILEKYKR
jgi:clan AA aspartic protease (TIGR02281 family)